MRYKIKGNDMFLDLNTIISIITIDSKPETHKILRVKCNKSHLK